MLFNKVCGVYIDQVKRVVKYVACLFYALGNWNPHIDLNVTFSYHYTS